MICWNHSRSRSRRVLEEDNDVRDMGMMVTVKDVEAHEMGGNRRTYHLCSGSSNMED